MRVPRGEQQQRQTNKKRRGHFDGHPHIEGLFDEANIANTNLSTQAHARGLRIACVHACARAVYGVRLLELGEAAWGCCAHPQLVGCALTASSLPSPRWAVRCWRHML